MAKNPFDRTPRRRTFDAKGRELFYVNHRMFETAAEYRPDGRDQVNPGMNPGEGAS